MKHKREYYYHQERKQDNLMREALKRIYIYIGGNVK